MLTVRNSKLGPNRPRQRATVHARYAAVNPEDFYWDPRYHTDDGDPDLDFAAGWANPNSGNMIKVQILKGLQGKERQYILRLAESFEALIQDGRRTVVSSPLTTYQRFLVYCCSVYYGLAFGVLPATNEIYNVRTQSSRIPHRRISDMAFPDVPAHNLLPATERRGRYEEAYGGKDTKREIGNSDAISPPNPPSSVVVDKGDDIGADGEIPTRQASEEEATAKSPNVKDIEAVRHTAHEDAKTSIFVGIEEKEFKAVEDGISYPSSNPVSPTPGVMDEARNGGGANGHSSATLTTSQAPPPDVDPIIIDALEGKERTYVLKLGETFEALIMEGRTSVEVTAVTAYQRLLVHRCSAYYKLSPTTGTQGKVSILSTADSRIPARRICELVGVPAELSAVWPTFKIATRGQLKAASGGSASGASGATNSSSGSHYSKASSRTESTDYGT